MRRGISRNAMRSLYPLPTGKYALVHPRCTLPYDSDCTIRRKASEEAGIYHCFCVEADGAKSPSLSVDGDVPSLSVDARRLSFKSGNLKSAGNVGLTS